MKNIEEKFNNAKKISLTTEERERMSAFLKSYREIHPVRDSSLLRRNKEGVSGFFNILTRLAAPAVLMLFIFGTGVVAAAQRALPGQILYPVKTSSEEVRSAFIVSGEAEARFDAERATRRLEEARSLATRGEASAEVVSDLEAQFVSHMNDLERHLEEIKQDRAEVVLEIESEFESAVRIYSQVLAALSGEGGAQVEGLTNTLVTRSARFDTGGGAMALMRPGQLESASGTTESLMFDTATEESAEPMEVQSLETVDDDGSAGEDTVTAPQEEQEEMGIISNESASQQPHIDESALEAAENLARKKLDLLASELDRSKVVEKVRGEMTDRFGVAETSFEEAMRVKNEGRHADALVHFNGSLATSQDALTVLRLLRNVTNPTTIDSILDNSRSFFIDINRVDREEVDRESVREEGERPSEEGSGMEEGDAGGFEGSEIDSPASGPEGESDPASLEVEVETSALPL